jgi:hypothetical protein
MPEAVYNSRSFSYLILDIAVPVIRRKFTVVNYFVTITEIQTFFRFV